jgi:alkanesulfonate monooxygenase SsuD/methylene tetrahydromethanopterin reductase-like flavin-dependent oxidoreductase (luciferase family)
LQIYAEHRRKTMRVSIGLPVADWAACAAAARQAEEDGADAVTASELKHDPFAPLAFAALATQRVALAACRTYRRSVSGLES